VKERLTGAIILVVLIVLLVPELLSGPKGPAAAAPAGSASPSSEEPPLRSYTINLGDDSHAQTEGSAAGTGSSVPEPSGPAQPTSQASVQPPGTPESQAAPAQTQVAGTPSSADSPQGTDSGWQADSPANAGAAAAAHPETPTPQPAPARQRAPTGDQSATRTAKSSASPQKTAPVQKPAPTPSATRTDAPKPTHVSSAQKSTVGSETAGAWGVQLGVFASRDNAERLALEVRVKGFKASVSPVSNGHRKLYRVRVGPAADRSGAQELQSRLKATGRPGGTVVPYS
jgi:DedD protein